MEGNACETWKVFYCLGYGFWSIAGIMLWLKKKKHLHFDFVVMDYYNNQIESILNIFSCECLFSSMIFLDILNWVRNEVSKSMTQHSSSTYFNKAIFLEMLEPNGFSNLNPLFHKWLWWLFPSKLIIKYTRGVNVDA